MTDVEIPALWHYQWVVLNSSAGKDSQVMIDEVVRLCDEKEVPRDRLVVVHADLGEVEWPGTKELAREQADHYDLRFEVEKRKGDDLLAYALRRGKWPSNNQRWCTSDFKRTPVSRLYTRLVDESRKKDPKKYHRKFHWKTDPDTGKRTKQYYTKKVQILNCFGFRAEESPARKKKQQIYMEPGRQSPFRDVVTWLPVHTWTKEDVWARIHESGVRHHWAYDRGMTRLSCRFCIFSPFSQLQLSAQQPENAELFQKYLAAERQMKHTFKGDHSLQDVADAIERGKEITEDDGSWNM
jgi:3'-phosphoadenosine 5'-phosphosulfate sulfotransferase (PAPS reductase)/FAD synthetase